MFFYLKKHCFVLFIFLFDFCFGFKEFFENYKEVFETKALITYLEIKNT
jgi:hypothetical protein